MSDFGTYCDILSAYDPELAKQIEARFRAGIDITDEMYEALCVHDELCAESFLDYAHDMCWGR